MLLVMGDSGQWSMVEREFFLKKFSERGKEKVREKSVDKNEQYEAFFFFFSFFNYTWMQVVRFWI